MTQLETLKAKAREQFIRNCNRWRSDGGFMTDDGLDFLAMNVFIEAVIETVYQARTEEVEAIIKGNYKGAFTDEAGNDCWYVDDLIATLKDTKISKDNI